MQSREPVNILLVDDQPAKLLSYESILSDLGENLIKANSGREALEHLLKIEIAVVLVDACMPELDGFELTSMIRNHPRCRKTSIILVSGLLTEDVDRLKGYVSGAVDYVSVPIVPEILRAKVSGFSDLFRKTGALEQLNQELEQRVEQRTAALSEMTEKLARAYEASHFLATIVESSNDAIIGQSLEGTIRTWNAGAERLYGYKSEEILGHNISELTPPDRLGEESAILEKLLKGERVEHFETVRLRKNGALMEVSLTISVIRDEAGELIGTSQVGRDITEQKRTAELMRQTQRLESLGVLAGGIAHDFNNLLACIVGNAGLALMELSPESPARGTVQSIEDAALRAAELTRQLLAYSGKGKFLIEPLNLSRVVEEMLHLLKLSISKKATLRTRLADDLPALEGDAAQIRQVVMNLITNASEALGDKAGDILVSTGVMAADRGYLSEMFLDEALPEGHYVYLEVTDTGCGMHKETQSRIFDPFFTTKFTGRGLGLAAVLGIIRSHRGAIKLYSEPGQGTAFKVLFPASEQRVPAIKPSLGSVGWRGTGTILIVDDEEGVRTVAGRMLEMGGFTVILARDGLTGIEMFRTHAAEIRTVLLDLTMPDLSGEEVFRAIRAIQPDAKVILTSGYNEQETISLFQGRGLAGFIQKPFQPVTLIEKVRQILTQTGPLGRSQGNA